MSNYQSWTRDHKLALVSIITAIIIFFLSVLCTTYQPEFRNYISKLYSGYNTLVNPTNSVNKQNDSEKQAEQKQTEEHKTQVHIERLEAYIHPSGAFSINFPTNWKHQQDDNKEKGSLLMWNDPSEKGIVMVMFFEGSPTPPPKPIEPDMLKTLLQGFQDNLDINLYMDKLNVQNDGSIKTSAIITVKDKDGTPVDMKGNIYAAHKNNNLVIVWTMLSSDQWLKWQSQMDKVTNSLKMY